MEKNKKARENTECYNNYMPVQTRACLKIHSRHLYAPLCGIFGPNSGYIAHYAPFIWPQSPTNCDAHLPESNFQTRSSRYQPELVHNTTVDRNGKKTGSGDHA